MKDYGLKEEIVIFIRYLFICIFMFSSLLSADERPKIGLVLSGGGARGGAHVGVIKLLEEKNIPIDAIAGTSMGSLVGGLYASGISIKEIEALLQETEWKRYIAYDYDREKRPIHRKRLEHDFPSDVKMGINKNNDIVLGTGLFKRQEMLQFLERTLRSHISDNEDFDSLRIPFRAVSSDLETGETVVLESGSLAESIYASIAIPGGFEPIVVDGKTLVDGGMADNLPIDVMRQMDVDIIIAVDISTPFKKDPKFDNYLDVMSQLSDILMRKNVEQSIASMKDNEILITPDLEGFTPLDSDRYAEIIAIGYESAQRVYKEKLSMLSVNDQFYSEYAKSVQPKVLSGPPVISDIVLENRTYLNDTTILDSLHVSIGEELDYEQLDKDIKSIYDLMIFEDVTYKLIEEDKGYVLYIKTNPKWDINGQLKFAFGFEDNFDGHSDYTAALEYIMFGLNSYGGEWRSRLAIGRDKELSTEWYQPLESSQTFFIRPSLFYHNNKVYVTPSIIGGHTVSSNLNDTIPVQAKEYGASASVGVNIKRSARFEMGIEVKEVEPSINVYSISFLGASYDQITAKQKVVKGYAGFEIDTLDNAFFPRTGMLGEMSYEHQLPGLGSENEYDQFYTKVNWALTKGYHTLLIKAKYGATFNSKNFDQSEDFNDFYTLGGLFNLSGLPRNSLTGDHMAFGGLVYRYQLSKDDFFGALSMPLYAGMSVEAGKAWYDESSLNIPQEQSLCAGSVYLAADTPIGPFYLGLGNTEGGYYSVYLMLGQGF